MRSQVHDICTESNLLQKHLLSIFINIHSFFIEYSFENLIKEQQLNYFYCFFVGKMLAYVFKGKNLESFQLSIYRQRNFVLKIDQKPFQGIG